MSIHCEITRIGQLRERYIALKEGSGVNATDRDELHLLAFDALIRGRCSDPTMRRALKELNEYTV